MSDYAMWAAIRTVKSRIGTWVGYQRMVDAGFTISRESWASWVGSAQRAIAERSSEMVRPLNRRPVPGEIIAYPSRRASGYMQTVQVLVRDRTTGIEETRFYSLRGDSLRSRGAVVTDALNRFRDAAASSPEDYPEDIVGAWYSGTYQLTPSG